MARAKAVAILLGPSGVGLVGMYATLIGFVGMIAGLGIGNSAVREITEANSSGDQTRLGYSTVILRRVSIFTGLLGWLLTALLAWPLCKWTFGSTERTGALALLGATLFLGAVSAGQSALLQGCRRISDIARMSVVSAVISTAISIGLYAFLGERGIIPVFLAGGLISLATSWWYARRINIVSVDPSWREMIPATKRMVQLGLAFMWGGVLTTGCTLLIRSEVVNLFGLSGNGIYQSAWTLSGMFAGFILGAMGTDFYPRLTAASVDNLQLNQLVNEQMEIGILLALPGLVGTLMFAPLAMHIFYSKEFLGGAILLPWFVLGVFGRVVSWPMSYIMMAKGASKWFATSETAANVVHFILAYSLMRSLGLWGVAAAFAILYVLYTLAVFLITRHLTGFFWTRGTIRLLLLSSALVITGMMTQYWINGMTCHILGVLITACSLLISIRGGASRLGPQHRIIKSLSNLPMGRRVLGL